MMKVRLASNRTVIKQSCTNTALFLCGLLGIVYLSERPVFVKQKNKIRSHLDRKRSLLLPGVQTVVISPHIVNLPLTQGLHEKPVIHKPRPEVRSTSVQLKGLALKEKSRLMTLFQAYEARFSGVLIVKHCFR